MKIRTKKSISLNELAIDLNIHKELLIDCNLHQELETGLIAENTQLNLPFHTNFAQ